MELFNLIADFFNSLENIYKVLLIVGAAVIVVAVVILCCVAANKKSKRKKLEQKEKSERNKRALDEFMSSPQEGEKELIELYNGNAVADGITSEPVVEKQSEEQPSKNDNIRAEELLSSEPTERQESDFCEEVERVSVTAIESGEAEFEESLTDGYVTDGEDEAAKEDVFAFANAKDKKPPVGFAVKLAQADDEVKVNYCDIVNYALSYKKLKMKKSAASEKAYCGSNHLFTVKINGKSLRVYFALRFADYENTTMPVSDESSKKSYERTPVMLKITSPLSVKRAKSLIDDVAKRFGVEKGKEKTVLSAEAV